MEIKVGSKVYISTHGSAVGTVIKIMKGAYGFDAVVQIDGEPGPRFCRMDIPGNVSLCI